jgi:hypothetical protein
MRFATKSRRECQRPLGSGTNKSSGQSQEGDLLRHQQAGLKIDIGGAEALTIDHQFLHD